MGLHVSHGCYGASYIWFSRFRNELAKAAGYIVKEVKWPYLSEIPLIDYGHITQDQVDGIWLETPSDPLMVLLAHSDCEGIIAVAQAGPLADRIEQLIPLLPEDEELGYRKAAEHFVTGLRAAVAANETVTFQ